MGARIPIFIVLMALANTAVGATRYTEALLSKGELGISSNECMEVENKLGQLFMIFVDGRGTHPKAAIHPSYLRAVKDLRLGGIRLGSNQEGADFYSSKEIIPKVQKEAALPVLVAIDSMRLFPVGGIGLGTYGGILGNSQKQGPACFAKEAFLQAFLHKAIGVNMALGPTIDSGDRWDAYRYAWPAFLENGKPQEVAAIAQPLIEDFDNFGIVTALKHFPYAFLRGNSHRVNSLDSEPPEKIKEMLNRFRILLREPQHSAFVMTTHLFNPNIDGTVVTFSEKWIRILRKDVGFDGLIISDGLGMLGAFSESTKELLFSANMEDAAKKKMLEQMKAEEESLFKASKLHRRYGPAVLGGAYSAAAAKAILAGHDMIIIDDSLSTTTKVFKDLHAMACQNNPTSNKLRQRIFESYERIRAFKETKGKQLLPPTNISNQLISRATALYSGLYDKTSKACTDEGRFIALKNQIEQTGIFSAPSHINPLTSSEDY